MFFQDKSGSIISEVKYLKMNELNSFILQFKHLWRSGQDAHLDLECQAGQAWVGIRVRLGQEPGLQTPKSRNRNTPSRQRHRARRAAACGEQEDHDAEEAYGQDDHIASEAHENKAAEAGNSVKAVEVVPVTPVDEFCSNAEFEENILSYENSVTYRFVVKDPTLFNKIEAFKTQVRQNFLTTDVEMTNQLFEIFGYEQLHDQSNVI